MSESTIDKTKRGYLKFLLSYKWKYQLTIFYVDGEDSIDLLQDKTHFLQKLRRKYPDAAFLTRINLKKKGAVTQAFLTIHSTQNFNYQRVKEVKEYFQGEVNILYRKVAEHTLLKAASRIKDNKPHDLNKFFSKNYVSRWSVLNKSKLEPKILEEQ